MRISAIIPAAGRGRRLGLKRPKAFVVRGGKPLIGHTLERLARSFHFQEMIVAAPPAEFGRLRRLFSRSKIANARLVKGGRTRAASVKNAVLQSSGEWVLIHDAVRPLIRPKTLRAVVSAAQRTGAAILAVPVTATVKKAEARTRIVRATEDRASLFLAQTPQVFRKRLLLERYRRLGRRALQATDEAALFDGSGLKVAIVAGDAENIKITTPSDLGLFDYYLRRTGRGAHRYRV